MKVVVVVVVAMLLLLLLLLLLLPVRAYSGAIYPSHLPSLHSTARTGIHHDASSTNDQYCYCCSGIKSFSTAAFTTTIATTIATTITTAITTVDTRVIT
jgi:hypothetical protein